MGELVNCLGNHGLASIVGAFSVISYGLGIAEQAQAITIRFKAWQLQALGAAFFFIAVVMVLVSYDQERRATRSEEHTSELQSLMRISYAVFCLKKKNNKIYTVYTKTA